MSGTGKGRGQRAQGWRITRKKTQATKGTKGKKNRQAKKESARLLERENKMCIYIHIHVCLHAYTWEGKTTKTTEIAYTSTPLIRKTKLSFAHDGRERIQKAITQEHTRKQVKIIQAMSVMQRTPTFSFLARFPSLGEPPQREKEQSGRSAQVYTYRSRQTRTHTYIYIYICMRACAEVIVVEPVVLQ